MPTTDIIATVFARGELLEQLADLGERRTVARRQRYTPDGMTAWKANTEELRELAGRAHTAGISLPEIADTVGMVRQQLWNILHRRTSV
jgi:hypothetical protein